MNDQNTEGHAVPWPAHQRLVLALADERDQARTERDQLAGEIERLRTERDAMQAIKEILDRWDPPKCSEHMFTPRDDADPAGPTAGCPACDKHRAGGPLRPTSALIGELRRVLAKTPGPPEQAGDMAEELDRLQKLCATWESAALAGLLALGLDDETAGRVGERIRALAGVKR